MGDESVSSGSVYDRIDTNKLNINDVFGDIEKPLVKDEDYYPTKNKFSLVTSRTKVKGGPHDSKGSK